MRYLMVRFCLFALPIAVPFALVYGTALYLGEALPMQRVIEMQQNASIPIYYRPMWQQHDIVEYKLRTAKYIDPDLLVLGSSRMLRYRDRLVTNPAYTFYNASIMSAGINQLNEFAHAMIAEDIRPDVIILGVDEWAFRQDSNFVSASDNHAEYSATAFQVYGFRRILNHWLSDETMWDRMQNARSADAYWLGLDAFERQSGYVYDGATINFFQEQSAELIMMTHRSRLNNRIDIYQTAETVSEAHIMLLADLLNLASSNDILVVGLFQPWHPDFLQVLQEHPDFQYWSLAKTRIQELFAEYEFPLLNFNDLERFGGNPNHMLDGHHYSEIISLQVYIGMLEELPDLLGQYSDIEKLRNDLENADDPHHVYPAIPPQ